VKLLNEANKEAGHKGFCDKELAMNKHTRDSKTSEVETMTAEVEGLTAKIAKLTEEIQDLTEAVAKLDAGIAKETEERAQEKVKNADTTKDAKNAQEAVAQALTVLKEFYAKAATATQFLQVGAVGAAPATSYNGMGGESGGITAMLEVIQEDFASLEAETKAAEDTAQNEFEKFMEESRMDKADKNAAATHKKSELEDSKTTLQTTKSDLEATQVELTAALRTFEKLKPSCVDAGVSYEERVNRRQEGIESLKEALKILSGKED